MGNMLKLISNDFPKFKLVLHLNGAEGGLLLYQDEALKVRLEIFTPKKNGQWGKEERAYSIDGDDRCFTSEQELMEAIRNKQALSGEIK